MTRQFFSGSSLEQAIMKAARHFGVDPDELEYSRIEKRHGFLRTRRAVVIAVDPEAPQRAAAPATPEVATPEVATPEVATPEVATSEVATPEVATPEPVMPEPVTAEPVTAEPVAATGPGPAAGEPPPPASDTEPAGDDELLAAAERSAGTLLRFAGIEATASARPGPERIDVEISGGDHDVLLVEGGRGLLAIQHLLPRMLRGLAGRSSYVRVDSGGFHQKRRERLEGLARREAETARKQGKARTLPPMAPDERRIIHMALNDDPTVITESRGAGLRKRVVIRPAEGERGAGFEPPRG